MFHLFFVSYIWPDSRQYNDRRSRTGTILWKTAIWGQSGDRLRAFFGVCADGYIVAWTKGATTKYSHGVAVTAFTPLCVASDLSRSAVNDMAPTNTTRGAAIDRQGPQRERSWFPQPSGFAFEVEYWVATMVQGIVHDFCLSGFSISQIRW